MKKSEKDALLSFIEDNSSTELVYVNNAYLTWERAIRVQIVKQYIENIPVDKEDIKEMYAIKELISGQTIWNARGGAYKEYKEVEEKLTSLQKLPQNKDKVFKIITYKLEERNEPDGKNY